MIDAAPTQLAGAGNPFLYVALREPARVDALRPDLQAIAELTAAHHANGVFVFSPQSGGVRSRMFAPELGIVEDPATGSATGPLGAYLAEHGFIARRDGERFVSEQGVALGRRSLLHGVLRLRDGALETVEVGGSAVHVAAATMEVPAA
jgi:trans-2,3-dihydro-3-hydroxyanthranilate isomerase